MRSAWLSRNVAVVMMSVAVAAHAQNSSPSTAPANAARAFFRDLEAREWSKAAQLIHQEALDCFRAEQLRGAETFSARLSGGDSSLRPEVRAYFDSIRATTQKLRNPLLRHFPGIPTLDSLRRLPPNLFLARFWLSGDVSAGGDPDGSSPRTVREVLKVRMVSDTVAYVVYRMPVDNHYPSAGPHVVEARKSNNRWVFMLNEELNCIGGCWTEYITEPDST